MLACRPASVRTSRVDPEDAMTRVVVVDDHPFFRACLVALINGTVDLQVVGECADGADVVSAVEELSPDVVVMDVQMPHLSGLDAAVALRRQHEDVHVLFLTSAAAESSRAAARAGGAAGYLLKGSDPHLVLDAIRQVAGGATLWPEEPASAPHAAAATAA